MLSVIVFFCVAEDARKSCIAWMLLSQQWCGSLFLVACSLFLHQHLVKGLEFMSVYEMLSFITIKSWYFYESIKLRQPLFEKHPLVSTTPESKGVLVCPWESSHPPAKASLDLNCINGSSALFLALNLSHSSCVDRSCVRLLESGLCSAYGGIIWVCIYSCTYRKRCWNMRACPGFECEEGSGLSSISWCILMSARRFSFVSWKGWRRGNNERKVSSCIWVFFFSQCRGVHAWWFTSARLWTQSRPSLNQTPRKKSSHFVQRVHDARSFLCVFERNVCCLETR